MKQRGRFLGLFVVAALGVVGFLAGGAYGQNYGVSEYTGPAMPAAVAPPDSFFVGVFANNLAGTPEQSLLITNTGEWDKLCVNAYAFNADAKMINCCSCPLQPNALMKTSVKELTGNGAPATGVIKILGSPPGTVPCDPRFIDGRPGLRIYEQTQANPAAAPVAWPQAKLSYSEVQTLHEGLLGLTRRGNSASMPGLLRDTAIVYLETCN